MHSLLRQGEQDRRRGANRCPYHSGIFFYENLSVPKRISHYPQPILKKLPMKSGVKRDSYDFGLLTLLGFYGSVFVGSMDAEISGFKE